MQDILGLIEETAVALFEVQPTNVKKVKRFAPNVRKLAALLEAAERPACANAAWTSAELVETCKAGDELAGIVETLTELMCDLQRSISNNVPDGECRLPRQLMNERPVAPASEPAKTTKSAKKSLPAPALEPEQPSVAEVVDAVTAVEPAPAPEAVAVANPSEPEADPFATFADPEMLAGFISEAQEHLETADVELLKLESDPGQIESLSAVFRAFHTIKGVAGFLGLTKIAKLSHEAENLLDRARGGELILAGEAMEVVFASVDALKQLVAALADGGPTGGNIHADPKLVELVARIQKVNVAQGGTVATALVVASEVSVGEEPASAPASAEKAQPAANATDRPASTGALPTVAETVKVDRARLDKLVDLIGELVIAESMVQDLLTAGGANQHGNRNIAQLNKITRNLQELGLSLRMVPVRATFQKMARLVRDLSKKIGKPIDFHSSGEDTELDKTVVDQIGDPLMHMVRNAVDHGIEASTDLRVQRGKPASGQVTLRAFHQGGNIYIEIQDDGSGLDRDRILKKARERGIIAEDAVLTDREAYNLIFAPGFSTAEKITDVSGRGVGMDVVRRNVEALRGSVELRSELGRGTCFSMRLPLTLAIIEGMTVRVGGSRYIIPTLSIVELLRPKDGDIGTVQQRGEFLTVRDRQLRLIRLGNLLGHVDSIGDPAGGIVVIVENAGTMTGLLVDEVLGQQQAVIKSLGSRLENQPGISGGAVMPDGRVGLILDVPGIVTLDSSASGSRIETA